MDIRLATGPLEQLETDALVILGFEGAPPDTVPGVARDGRVQELYDSGEFTGKALESAILHGPSGIKSKRLALAGAGDRSKFTPADLRTAVAAALRALKCKGAKRVALALGDFAGDDFVSAAVEGAILGDFEPDQLKTDPKKNDKRVDSFTVVGGSQSAVDQGRILGESQNFSRSLANEPGNLMTPTRLAERAREMSAQYGLECEVLDQDRMRQLGMGALLGVAQGSAEPPALIVIRYRPANSTGTTDHLGLIGKGVTFDTGGISIKPSEGMEKMKYDMAGGAAVLGAMQAIAQLKPAIPVTALVPTVENMPGSRAQRPGDIVTSLSGKTVEVLNTDAEGRMILIDALTYASRLGCTHLVDAATLTGAIVVALGHVRSGAFTNNDGFLGKLLAAADSQGEKMWHMPLDEDYKESLKSAFADLQNIGPRWGGAVTAAMFIREFVGDTPWVHLDIAGTAWLDDAKPFMAKGPSGVGVRTFVKLAMSW
jgi:leucyl aminopeptidase